MKPAVYVRVSTVGQNEVGQRREITRWLKGNRVDNSTWYVDQRAGTTWTVPSSSGYSRPSSRVGMMP